jgi:hypothetical protein
MGVSFAPRQGAFVAFDASASSFTTTVRCSAPTRTNHGAPTMTMTLSRVAAGAVAVGVVLWLWHEQRQRSAALLATVELKVRQRAAMESAEAQVLRTALCAFYTTHAPENLANVEDLVARVVGGPPTSVSGVSVGGSLWTADELCAKVEAKYGAKLVL